MGPFTRWTVCTAVIVASGSSFVWKAPLRKATLDTNKNGYIEKNECICDVQNTTFENIDIPKELVDYSALKQYEGIASSIAAVLSTMNGDVDPQQELAMLSDMLYQDTRSIVAASLCYTPDSYGTAFNKTYDMRASAKLVSEMDCSNFGRCNFTDEHLQENLTVRFVEQIGRNATLHCPLVYRDTCCAPVSYGDYLGTSEFAWTDNYFSPDPFYDSLTLPIRDYLYGNTTWLQAGQWSDPYVDPEVGIMVSFSIPFVTRVPMLGSVDPFILRDKGHRNPGFMESFEGFYVMGVVGVRVNLPDFDSCPDGFYSTYPTCSACPEGTYRTVTDPVDACRPCAVGYFAISNASAVCKPCRKGSATSFVGQSQCQFCQPGTFQSNRAMTSCLLCPPGYIQPEINGTDCSQCLVGQYSPDLGSSACLLCRPGSSQKELGMSTCSLCVPGSMNTLWNATYCNKCPIGKYAPERGMTTCFGCKPGTVQQDVGMRVCSLCPAGSINSEWNASACIKCPIGNYAPGMGATACLSCQPGTARNERGASICLLCPPGSAVDVFNASTCIRCPSGQYAAERGLASCAPCPNYMATPGLGSDSVQDCICAQGLFLGAISQRCETCPGGMSCKVASLDPAFGDEMHAPSLLPGYYSTPDLPLSVYSCVDTTSCPGGAPGTCGGGRIALACQLCERGQYPTTEGGCQDCDKAGIGPLVCLICVSVIFAALSHTAVNFPLLKTKSSSMAGVFLAGLIVSTILSFNIYSNLNTVWVSPLSDLFALLRIAAFDLKLLKFSCFAWSSKLLPRYAFKIAAIPGAFIVVCLGAFLMQFTKWTRHYAFCTIPDLLNSGGLLFSVFFIAVTLASVEGFNCVNNPNGIDTLMSDRSIVCWHSQDHLTLTVASTVAMLAYPVNFLVVTGFCTLRYYALARRFGTKFTFSMRFLVSRWKPDRYYYGIIYTVRNFALTIAPLAQPNNFDIQVASLQLIYISWLVVQLNVQPWRFKVLDQFDAISSSMQIVVVTCFSLLGGKPTGDALSAQGKGYIALFVFLFYATLTCLAIAFSLAQKFMNTREFGLFLSHHKGADALYARQIKLMLTMLTNRGVFLDVDNLASLDELVFLVRSSVDNLVVMLSPQTLSRFWCAVEIICAVKNQMPIILTKTHQVDNLFSDEFLDGVSSMWEPQQILDFNKVGIDASNDPELAYRFVASLPIIMMMMDASERAQLEAVSKIVSIAKGCRTEKRAYKIESHQVAYIVYNTNCFIQASCARILCMLMKASRWNCLILYEETKGAEVIKSVLLILVSQGFSTDPVALGHLCYLVQNGTPFTTIVSQEDFQRAMPSKLYLKTFEDGTAFNEAQLATFERIATGVSASSIADVVRAVYASLAASLNPANSAHLLNVELSTIIMRAEQLLATLGRPGHVRTFIATTSLITSSLPRALDSSNSVLPREFRQVVL